MADVYEQNLPSKANLTVNDYIRVVGSDNNSYKQLVSDVAQKIIENYTGSSLAGSSQSVKSALDALNSKINGYIENADFNNITTNGLYYCNAMTANKPDSNFSTYVLIAIFATSSAGKQIAFSMTDNTKLYIRYKLNGSWSAWSSK